MTYIPDFAKRNFVSLLKKTVVYIQQHETYKSDNKTWSSFPLFLFLTLLIGRREIEREDDIKKKEGRPKYMYSPPLSERMILILTPN